MEPTRIVGGNLLSRRNATIMLLVECCVAFIMAVFNPPKSIGWGRPKRIAARTNSGGSSADSRRCVRCHADEVNGFARSKMSHSMRIGRAEPAGVVRTEEATITMHSDKSTSWQTIEDSRGAATYHVDYVIGSGTHASGYITDLDNHLFQSPVAYYASSASYGLAPGYENKPDPDFTRPVTEGCVFCHSGRFSAIPGTINQYDSVPFPELAIGCDRCHGSPVEHLAHPQLGNIVNPQKLPRAARDSICEQCHLIGSARVLNTGSRRRMGGL